MRNKLNLTQVALRRAIVVVLFLCQPLIVSSVFGEPTSTDRNVRLESDGYRYEYQSVPVLHPVSKKLMFYTGKITVSSMSNQQVIYEENTTIQPGCDGFASISKLSFQVSVARLLGGDPKKDRMLTVLCGSNAGRHPTIKVFFFSPVGLRATALDFEESTPNISATTNSDGIYKSVVYRRIMFSGGDGIGTTPFIFVYILNVDSSSFGFSPQFGQGVARHYLDYYQSLSSALKTEISPDYIGPMISALFASKDKDTICRETRTLASKGVQPAVIREWAAKLPDAGYPYFDLNNCEEK